MKKEADFNFWTFLCHERIIVNLIFKYERTANLLKNLGGKKFPVEIVINRQKPNVYIVIRKSVKAMKKICSQCISPTFKFYQALKIRPLKRLVEVNMLFSIPEQKKNRILSSPIKMISAKVILFCLND